MSERSRLLGFGAHDPRRHLVAVLLLMICAMLLWESERGRSLTADEPLHLIRGHAWWWTHDSRLSYAHPPLANVINTAPYADRGDEPWGAGATSDGKPRNKTRSWEAKAERTRAEALRHYKNWGYAQPLAISTAYFGHDFRAAKAELTGARRMMMLWVLAFGAFLYAWVERRWGWTSGFCALSLYAVHPSLIAHGRLMTTDFPLAATTFVSLAALIAWIERPGWGRAALFWLASTAMVLTKHSGLPFVVLMSLGLLVAAGVGAGGFADDGRRRGARVALVFAQLCVVALVMILAIDAIYLFDRVGLRVDEILAEPEPHNWISRKYRYDMLERSPLKWLPEWLRLPFPYTWIVGLVTVSKQNANGHGNFFFGLNDHDGHPLYFPVMLFIKSPTGLLVLLGASVGLLATRWRSGRRPSLATWVLAAFALAALASASASSINIGVRHVLPLIPITIVFAGRAGGLLLDDPPALGVSRWLGPRWLRAILVSACLVSAAAGAAWTFPHYLADFNILVGGPKGGHEISVIGEDWGQDLGDLADVAEAEGWDRVVYYTRFPLRSTELRARGLKVRRLRCKKPYEGPDPVVIHLDSWVRKQRCFRWLDGREPDIVVNHHLLVFEQQ